MAIYTIKLNDVISMVREYELQISSEDTPEQIFKSIKGGNFFSTYGEDIFRYDVINTLQDTVQSINHNFDKIQSVDDIKS
jgi:hypothetical protein